MYEVSKISSVTYSEMIELRSTLHALTNTKFICSICQGRYKSLSNGEQMLAKYKKNMGCEEIKPAVLHPIMQSKIRLNYSTCVGNFVSDSCIYWINSYNHFEKGTMPFKGGYMEQPAKLIEVMNIIGAHKQEQILQQTQKKNQSAKTSMRMLKGGR